MSDDVTRLLAILAQVVSNSGASIDLHIRIGGNEEVSEEMIVSDLGSQPAQYADTDLHFGFSSPAGQQWWEEET